MLQTELFPASDFAQPAPASPQEAAETPIEAETPLLPYFFADRVVWEATLFLQTDLPEDLAEQLAARAEHLYQVNRDFRRKLRGNAGREYLYSFMRHWTVGLLKRAGSPLADRLPASFANGRPLP